MLILQYPVLLLKLSPIYTVSLNMVCSIPQNRCYPGLPRTPCILTIWFEKVINTLTYLFVVAQLYKCNHFHRASKSSLLNFVVDQNKLTFGAPSNRPSASPLMLGFEEESSDLDSGSKRPKRRPIIEELDWIKTKIYTVYICIFISPL